MDRVANTLLARVRKELVMNGKAIRAVPTGDADEEEDGPVINSKVAVRVDRSSLPRKAKPAYGESMRSCRTRCVQVSTIVEHGEWIH